MKYLLFILFIFYSCSNNDIEQNTNYRSGFDFDATMDLCNLQSDNPSKFQLNGTKIVRWYDETNGNYWEQTTISKQPEYINGIPTFSGVGTFLKSNSVVTATNFSMYFVIKNTGKQDSKAVFSHSNNTNMRFSWYSNLSRASYRYNTVNNWNGILPHGGNRDVIVSIRVTNSNKITVAIDGTVGQVITHNFSGQPLNIDVLMGLVGFNNWSVKGELKAFCITSEEVSDDKHELILNHLFERYNIYNDETKDSILVIGDSNIAGSTSATSFVSSLSIATGLPAGNLGISGSLLTPTSGIVNNSVFNRLPQIRAKNGYDFLIIWAGTNDLIYNVSSSTYENYYRKIVNDVLNSGQFHKRIILCTPPYQKGFARQSQIIEYSQVLQSIANEYDIHYFDVNSFMIANGGNALLYDTVHLTTEAHLLISEQLKNIIL